MKPWHLGVMIACLILIATGSVGGVLLYSTQRTTEELRRSQLASCERGNALRSAIGVRDEILGEFIIRAAEARTASAAAASTGAQRRIDTEAARAYYSLADRLEVIPQVICADAVP